MVLSKWFTTVVLPLPEGAEKIMTLFKELQRNKDFDKFMNFNGIDGSIFLNNTSKK